MMGVGDFVLSLLEPILESIGPFMPGTTFPAYFEMELFQRALIAAIIVTVIGGMLGGFLIMRNLALMGDGLAHVSFGGIAVGVALSSTAPLWYGLLFSIIASILIHEMQSRELLTGDASIGIFLTGTLALGLVVLRVWGGGITTDIEGYLYGNINLIGRSDLDLIIIVAFFALTSLYLLHGGLLASTLDPVAAQLQGIPVRFIGLWFSVMTAAVVVAMVNVVGVLLVTSLLVTPAATGQLIGRSFKGCLLWTQFFGLSSVILGIYYSAELGTGGGATIALVSALLFPIVLTGRTVYTRFLQSPALPSE